MTDAESERPCPVCQAPLAPAQVFARADGDRVHVECFFVLKAAGKLTKPTPSRARGAS